MKTKLSRFEMRVIAFVTILILAWLTTLACRDSEKSNPVATTGQPATAFDPTPCEADSLRAVIKQLRFVIGQQTRMINCLQQGGRPEDCYGGI